MSGTCPCCGYQLERLDSFCLGDLHVSGEFGMVTWKGEVPRLTKTERAIVLALAMARGDYVSRFALIEAGGFDEIGHPDNQLTVMLGRVRHAFREIDPGFDHIESLRGVGLRWKLEATCSSD